MATIQNHVASNFDLQGLSSLKSGGVKTSEETRALNAKLAAEFESMFLKQMTDSMQESLKPMKSDLINNDSMELFEGMFYDEVSRSLSQHQSLGLVDWLNDISEARNPEKSSNSEVAKESLTDISEHLKKAASNNAEMDHEMFNVFFELNK
jgi:Rod binding domain-containing protein